MPLALFLSLAFSSLSQAGPAEDPATPAGAATQTVQAQHPQQPQAHDQGSGSPNGGDDQSFGGATPTQARDLFVESFGTLLDGLQADPIEPAGEIVGYLSDNVARVDTGSPGGDRLAVSTVPLRATNDGLTAPLDLTLEHSGQATEPANPLVSVRLPDDLRQGISVGEGDLVFHFGQGAAPRRSLQGEAVLYADAENNVDLVAAPMATGAELTLQLRSDLASETQRLEVDLPAGAQLRQQGAGAVIEQGDRPLALVHPPYALDAAGEQVPVTMQVDGSSLVLHVSYRDGGFQMPIAVDPFFEGVGFIDTYAWTQTDSAGLGSWGLYGSSGNPFWLGYVCSAGVSCDYTGSSYGLYTSAQPARSFTPGSYGGWVYNVPHYSDTGGTTTYIPRATFGNVYWRSTVAYDYYNWSPYLWSGIFGASGWTGSRIDTGNTALSAASYDIWPNTAVQSGQQVYFMMLAGWGATTSTPAPNLYGWRSAYLGGAIIYLDDTDFPVVTPGYPQHSGMPSGWVDRATPSVTLSAKDMGLGVRHFAVYYPQRYFGEPFPWVADECNVPRPNWCPREIPKTLSYDTDKMLEGISTVTARVSDALGKWNSGSDATWQVKVDRTPPTATVTGGLYTGSSGTDLQIVASDTASGVNNENASAAQVRSGVSHVELYIDNHAQPDWVANPACNAPYGTCPSPVTLNPDLPLGSVVGTHHYKVVVTDQVGHPITQPVEWDNAESPQGYVYHASAYTGDPYATRQLLGEEWVEPGSSNARQSSTDYLATRGTVPCAAPGGACGEVRIRTHSGDVDPSAAPDWSRTRGYSVDDARLPLVGLSEQVLNDRPTTVAATGPIENALFSWQTPPPGHASTFIKYEGATGTVIDGSDSERTYRVWIDPGTSLPIRAEMRIGDRTTHLMFSYDTGVTSTSASAPDLFLQNQPTPIASEDSRTLGPPIEAEEPEQIPEDETDAIRFRQESGLSTDSSWVTALQSDPTARLAITKFGIPLSPSELAEMELRDAVADAAITLMAGERIANASSFGGLWLEPLDGTVHVGTTSDPAGTQARLREAFPYPNMLSTYLSPVSEASLAALATQVSEDRGTLAANGVDVVSSGAEVSSGKVIVQVNNLDAADEAYRRQHYSDTVEFVDSAPVEAVPFTAGFRNQSRFTIAGGEYLRRAETPDRCTTGFGMLNHHQHYPDTSEALIAGHCGVNGTSFLHAGHVLGHMIESQYNVGSGAKRDAGAMSLPNGNPFYYLDTVLLRMGSDGKPVSAVVHDFLRNDQLPQGLKVCRVGVNWDAPACGYLHKNAPVFQDTPFAKDAVYASFDICAGDSGGPVYRFNGSNHLLAIGILTNGYSKSQYTRVVNGKSRSCTHGGLFQTVQTELGALGGGRTLRTYP